MLDARYQGILSAIPTPFVPDGGLDADAVGEHVERQVKAGITGLLVIGGTGEFSSLDDGLRRRMVERTVLAARGRVPVVAGVLHPGLHDAARAANEYLRAGADSVMVVTPYYNRPTQDGIAQYFERLGDLVDGDLVLYEIPYRTGTSLAPQTVSRIVERCRVVAMKACNPDFSQQMEVVDAVGRRVAILSGEEMVFPMHVSMGAVGGMLAGSNLFPRAWTRILELARGGELAAARQLHARLLPVTRVLYSEPNPGPLKAAMHVLGLCAADVLPPLLEASAPCRQRLAQTLPEAMAIERGFEHPSPAPRHVR